MAAGGGGGSAALAANALRDKLKKKLIHEKAIKALLGLKKRKTPGNAASLPLETPEVSRSGDGPAASGVGGFGKAAWCAASLFKWKQRRTRCWLCSFRAVGGGGGGGVYMDATLAQQRTPAQHSANTLRPSPLDIPATQATVLV